MSTYPLEATLRTMARAFIAEQSWPSARMCFGLGLPDDEHVCSLRISVDTAKTTERAEVQERTFGSFVVEYLKIREAEADKNQKAKELTVALNQILGDGSGILSEDFRSEARNLHTVMKACCWDEDDVGAYVTPSDVQGAISYFKSKRANGGGGEIAKGWQLFPMLVAAEAAATKFLRDASLEEGHAKELTALASKFNLPTAQDLGEDMSKISTAMKGEAEKSVKSYLGLLGVVSKRFQHIHQAEIEGLQQKLDLCQATVSQECLTIFWKAVMTIGEAALSERKIEKEMLNKCELMVQRCTSHDTFSTVFNNEAKELLQKRLSERKQAWTSWRDILKRLGDHPAQVDLKDLKMLHAWLMQVSSVLPPAPPKETVPESSSAADLIELESALAEALDVDSDAQKAERVLVRSLWLSWMTDLGNPMGQRST